MTEDLRAVIRARAKEYSPFWHEVGEAEKCLRGMGAVIPDWKWRAETCREAAQRCMAAAVLADELAEGKG